MYRLLTEIIILSLYVDNMLKEQETVQDSDAKI